MMTIQRDFMVPTYYGNFHCKCGACRHTCCVGLDVTISDEEYFRLVGLQCSPALRSDLDVALRPLRDADPGRYAQLSPDFFGRCRLLDEQGLCRLQSECGFTALAAVCQYFPRNPRYYGKDGQTDPMGEDVLATCAMSNACEETLDLLYAMEGPLETVRMPLTFELSGKPDVIPVKEGKMAQMRTSDRELKGREAQQGKGEAGGGLAGLDEMAGRAVADVLQEEWIWSGNAPGDGQNGLSVRVLQDLIAWIGDSYMSMHPYAMAVRLRVLRGFTKEDLQAELQRLQAHYPRYDDFLRRVISNELFCGTLSEKEALQNGDTPRQNGTSKDAAAGLDLLRYMIGALVLLCAVNLGESSTDDDLIDLFADFFRVVDLTNYRHNSRVIIRRSLEARQG